MIVNTSKSTSIKNTLSRKIHQNADMFRSSSDHEKDRNMVESW